MSACYSSILFSNQKWKSNAATSLDFTYTVDSGNKLIGTFEYLVNLPTECELSIEIQQLDGLNWVTHVYSIVTYAIVPVGDSSTPYEVEVYVNTSDTYYAAAFPSGFVKSYRLVISSPNSPSLDTSDNPVYV